MTKNPIASFQKIVGLALLTACLLTPLMGFSQNAPSLLLFDFENKRDIGKVIQTDAKLNLLTEGQNHALKVTLGHNDNQPSVKLSMDARDLSDYLGIAMNIKNLGSVGIGVEAQCYNEIMAKGDWPNKSMVAGNPDH